MSVSGMTDKDKSTIQRQLGVIEGAAIALNNTATGVITDAIFVISEILDRMEGGGENG